MAISFVNHISPEHGLVLLVSVILAFECILFGVIFPGKMRGKLFPLQFMKKKFGKIHENEVKADIKYQGYPDMGSGRYSQELSYKDWYAFNCAQRVHLNFVESIATYLLLLLVGGLSYPLATAALGSTLVVGQLIYSIGYMMSPAMRVPGALLIDAALVGLLGLAGYSSFSLMQKRKWF